MREAIAPTALMTNTNRDFSNTFHIALNQGSANAGWTQTINAIKKDWRNIYPDDPFDLHFVDENIGRLYEKEQHTVALLKWATGLSILISCLGLLGFAIYTTERRTKEIGVRKVLGASFAHIMLLLSSEIAALVTIASLIAIPIAWIAMSKWLQNFAYHTSITWWIFACGGCGILFIALITTGIQTVKAAIANPVKSLRSE